MAHATAAQINALHRIQDMLNEGSFQYLSQTDKRFAGFIEELYGQVDQKMTALERQSL